MIKKTTDKKVESKKVKTKVNFPEGKYTNGLGRRKTSIAQVRVYEKGKGNIFINNVELNKYFPTKILQDKVLLPLQQTAKEGLVDVYAKILGGGKNGQAEALRLGISIALTKIDKELRTTLKKLGLLTRDSRMVERKKPGLKKARRAPQWAKR